MGVKLKNADALDRFNDKMDSLINGSYVVDTEDKIMSVINDFIDDLTNQIDIDKTDASGRLKASIQPLPYEEDNGVLKIGIKLESYWRDVNDGTKPKGFTIENRRKLQPQIRLWIANKPSLQMIAKGKKAQRSLSYAIATNILKKGTIKRFGYKGSGFMTKHLDNFKKNIYKAFTEGFLNKR